jgi:ubiquinone/menaquinone biosynthesis C-methylase UbiE
MRLISLEDFRDLYLKVIQRGFTFILTKISLNETRRTKSSFNDINLQSSNWWIIPDIRKRWNKMITGSPSVTYEEYISKEVFLNSGSIKMLSLGSGVCSHELRIAELNPHWEILCIDFSENLIDKAREIALTKDLHNIRFIVEDVYTCHLPDAYFDIVFFHSSLHHFKNLKRFIPDKVVNKLIPNGKLIIHEYIGPNRLQYHKNQLKAINTCIRLIDSEYRTMFKSRLKKNTFYGSGLLRMITSDPTECIDSENILPVIHKYFKVIIEKPLGGNLLMNVLKDIAHHFVDMDKHKYENMNRIFNFEDDYLLENKSDFLFGIYEKTTTRHAI